MGFTDERRYKWGNLSENCRRMKIDDQERLELGRSGNSLNCPHLPESSAGPFGMSSMGGMPDPCLIDFV